MEQASPARRGRKPVPQKIPLDQQVATLVDRIGNAESETALRAELARVEFPGKTSSSRSRRARWLARCPREGWTDTWWRLKNRSGARSGFRVLCRLVAHQLWPGRNLRTHRHRVVLRAMSRNGFHRFRGRRERRARRPQPAAPSGLVELRYAASYGWAKAGNLARALLGQWDVVTPTPPYRQGNPSQSDYRANSEQAGERLPRARRDREALVGALVRQLSRSKSANKPVSVAGNDGSRWSVRRWLANSARRWLREAVSGRTLYAVEEVLSVCGLAAATRRRTAWRLEQAVGQRAPFVVLACLHEVLADSSVRSVGSVLTHRLRLKSANWIRSISAKTRRSTPEQILQAYEAPMRRRQDSADQRELGDDACFRALRYYRAGYSTDQIAKHFKCSRETAERSVNYALRAGMLTSHRGDVQAPGDTIDLVARGVIPDAMEKGVG